MVKGKRDAQLSSQCISISILQHTTAYYSILQYITVYYSILHLLKLHLVRLSIHAWFLEVFQCCFRITLGVGDSSEGGDGSKGEERDKWTHLCTSHLSI